VQLAATTSVTAARMILDAMPCLINVGTYCPLWDTSAGTDPQIRCGLIELWPLDQSARPVVWLVSHWDTQGSER
jgi:hypothetical protein